MKLIKTANTSVMSAGNASSRTWISRTIGDEFTNRGSSELKNQCMTLSGVNTAIKAIVAMALDVCANIGANQRKVLYKKSIKSWKFRRYWALTRSKSWESQSYDSAGRARSRELRTGSTRSLRIVLWSMPSRKVHYRQRRNEKKKMSDREILRKRDQMQRLSVC